MALSPARRTNRFVALGLVAIAAVVVSAIAFGGNATAPDTSPPSTSTTTTTPQPSVGTLTRPANVSTSWFNNSFGSEQFDYEMDDLSCEAVKRIITPDLCGVARHKNGDVLLLGSESFWDPSDTASDGTAYIPFQMSVFVLRDDTLGKRASSVMDGFSEKAYSANRAQMDLYKATINGDEVLILHKRLTDEKADAYSFWESVQVISSSTTGAPVVVAAYQGARLRVAVERNTIQLSSLRYRASATGEADSWHTLVALSPPTTDDAPWLESPTTGPEPVAQGRGMTLLDSHRFPATNRGPAVDPSST